MNVIMAVDPPWSRRTCEDGDGDEGQKEKLMT